MNHGFPAKSQRSPERAQVRTVLAVLISFGMGVLLTTSWFLGSPGKSALSLSTVSLPNPPPAEVQEQPAPAPAQVQVNQEPDPVVVAAVNRSIPNLRAASLEGGTRILREAALSEFERAVQDLQARQKKLQLSFMEGQNHASDQQQRAAAQELRQLQAEQMEKLKEIAARSKAEIDAFQQLKGSAR